MNQQGCNEDFQRLFERGKSYLEQIDCVRFDEMYATFKYGFMKIIASCDINVPLIVLEKTKHFFDLLLTDYRSRSG